MEGEISCSRFETRTTDLLVDAAPSTIDRAVLRSHNGLDRRLPFHVTRKPGNLWDDDDDLRSMRRMREVCAEKGIIPTLNFFPSRAALRIRSTSAAAI